LGIGTSSPLSFAKQTIQFDGGGTVSQAMSLAAYGGSPTISFRSAAGTFASPSATTTVSINLLGATTSDGTTFLNTSAIQSNVDTTASTGSHPTHITLSTTPSGSTTRLERMRITSAGVLELSQGQIKFPATQSASADANTLDDYEEGTWTPIIKGTSTNPSYTTSGASGNYVKIGKMVYVSFLVIVTGVSSQGTGNIYLDALPFTVSDQSYAPSLTVMYNDAWDVDFRAMYASGISWTMRPIGVTQANATWGGSSNLSTGYFSGSGCYLTT
jgi:hypothetical protein